MCDGFGVSGKSCKFASILRLIEELFHGSRSHELRGDEDHDKPVKRDLQLGIRVDGDHPGKPRS
jgi:hypothetical protein